MTAAAKRETMLPAAGDLDLRALPAPEPMVRALAATDTLEPGATLVLWTPVLPLPLLQMLAARDLESTVEMFADGTARVTVRHPLREAGRGRR
jgi:hypothetical protein